MIIKFISLYKFGDWLIRVIMSYSQQQHIPSSASLLSVSVHCGLLKISNLHVNSVVPISKNM